MKKIIDLVGLSVAINNIKLWVQSLLGSKADSATTLKGYNITDAFTKTEVNTALEKKANTSDVYTKAQTDSTISAAIATKANNATTLSGYGITDAYTKTQTESAITSAFNTFVTDINNDEVVNTYKELIDYAVTHGSEFTALVGEVSKKANLSDVYTQAQVNTTISAALTGKADMATTLAGYGITDAYTQSEVEARIENIDHFNKMICFNGDIHLCGNEGNVGGTIYFGDYMHGDDIDSYAFISDNEDDQLTIYASGGVNISDTAILGSLAVTGSTTLQSTNIGTSTTSQNLTIKTKQLQLEVDGNMYLSADSGGNDPCANSSVTVQSLLSNNLIEITYEDLVQLRDSSRLQSGRFYRIINYWTLIDSNNLQIFDGSCTRAGHQFDIIVLALSPSTLSEEAWATHHNFGGDYDDSFDENPEYFANSNLSAWKLWYCLDNDTARFDWAHSEKGKGVIYRMIDEFGNDCPYDFKNILFNGYYTFSVTFNAYISASSTTSYKIWRDASLNYTNTRVTDIRENHDTIRPNASGKSLTVTTICKNNKISYNVHNHRVSASLFVTDLTCHLCKNTIVFDQRNIDGNINATLLCCVNNSINGIGNNFTTARGLGSARKIIANNLLSNCFNVVVDETQSGAKAEDAYLVNNTLYNINYNTSIETTVEPKVLVDILAANNAYKFTGQNRLIINGDIFANTVYQSNS